MCIYSIFGYGKCKTESAIGMAIRAIANDHKVLFAQFLKDGSSSEIKYLEDKIDIINSNTKGIVLPQNKQENNYVEVNSLYRDIFNTIANGDYKLLILDEILVAIDMGMISFAMLDLLLRECKSNGVDVYMTGRVRNANVRQHIIDISDCVTDARCKKHMFNRYCEHCHNDFPFHYTYCPDCGSELKESRPCKLGRDF